MATAIDTPIPVPGRAQPPIWPLKVGAYGGFMQVRSSPAEGACGIGTYPCKHPGVDVVGDMGARVNAPESGTVVLAADGSSSPVGGYGPWVVIIEGDSGKYHLLGHLSPLTASMALVGTKVVAGQQVGTVSSAYHTHWEVRSKAIPDFTHGESNATNNSDPIQWLSERNLLGDMGSILLLGAAATLLYLLWDR